MVVLTWAVGAHQARLVLGHEGVFDTDHILLGDALGDTHDQRDLGLQRLQHRRSGKRRRDIDDTEERTDSARWFNS